VYVYIKCTCALGNKAIWITGTVPLTCKKSKVLTFVSAVHLLSYLVKNSKFYSKKKINIYMTSV
jgi:hypothetical protein